MRQPSFALAAGAIALLAVPVSAALSSLASCALDPFPIPGALTYACSGDAECDDENPCTTDTCTSGACAHAPVGAGTSCGSTDVCQGAQTCDGKGTCATGTPVDADDGDPCTTDTCDPASGAVTHAPVPACWAPLPTTGAPTARFQHTAVWTGSKMIVWGGTVGSSPSSETVTATGAVYDPVAGTWTPTSMTGAPAPRTQHVAVWTGSKMIVWGGYGLTDYETGGGQYDPAADTWTALSTDGAPSGRTGSAALWTGQKLLIWGGIVSGAPLGDGAVYDPVADAWTAMPTAGALSPRFNLGVVLAGTQLIFWGGYDTVDWHADGASYDPVAGAWLAATPTAGAPDARERHSAVWTGSDLVVWGGLDSNQLVATGGALDTVAGTWTALAATGAPSARGDHTGLWTGSAMFIWGGCGGQLCDALGDGALWTPAAAPGENGGTWTPVPANAVLEGRHAHSAVWTGTKALIWGGQTATALTATGASFSP